MSDKELEEINGRLQNATKGTWKAYIEGRDFTSGSSFIMTVSDDGRGSDIELIGANDADIDFIAHAKQDIPKLINEIKRLKELINQLKQ